MKNNDLRFVLVGQTYAIQSIQKFLTFISNENMANQKRIELHYFGNNYQLLLDLCAQQGISSEFIVDHGYHDASSLIESIRNYDAAFLPYFGLEKLNVARESFPSKFAVYVTAELPIFYVGYAHNKVSQIIKSSQIGLCFDDSSTLTSRDLEEFIRTVRDSEFKDRIRITYDKYFSEETFLKKLSEIFNLNFKTLSKSDSPVGKYHVNDRLRYQDIRTHKYISNRLNSLVQKYSLSSTPSINKNFVLQIVYKNSTEIEFRIFKLTRLKFSFIRNFICTQDNKLKTLMSLKNYFKTENCSSILVIGFEDLELYNLSSDDNLDKILSFHRNSRKHVFSKTPFYRFDSKNNVNIPKELTIFDELGLTSVIRALLSKLNFSCSLDFLYYILHQIEIDESFRLNFVKEVSKLRPVHYHDPSIGLNKKDFYNSKMFHSMSLAQKRSYLDFLFEYITTIYSETSYDITSTMKLLAFTSILGVDSDDFLNLLHKPPLDNHLDGTLVFNIAKEYFDSQNDLNTLLRSKKLVFLNFLARLKK